MFTFPGRKKSNLEQTIDVVTADLLKNTDNPQELERLTAILERLTALREKRVSPDTVATVLANLAGIVLVLGYEHGHVITTRALSMLTRVK